MKARASSLMTTGVVSVRVGTSLAAAARTLACHPFGALPVVDANDVPIGIVTESDLMRLLLASSTSTTTVGDFMSSPVDVIDEMETVDDAIGRMRTKRIHHLPVVRDGKLVGMVTPGDVVRWFVTNRLGSLPALA